MTSINLRKSILSLFIFLSSSLFLFSSIHFTSWVKGEVAEGSGQTGDPTVNSWPMFGHDLRHTGFSPSSAPHTPDLLWEYSPLSDIDYVYSSPAVANGRVFIGIPSAEVICLAKVICLNESDGTLLWSYGTNGTITSSPAVVDGRVFIGSDNSWRDDINDYVNGGVHCLNATNGAPIWNYITDAGAHYSSPAVVNGRLFIGLSQQEFNRGYLCCLNASNGAHIWNYTGFHIVGSSPAVVDGKVFVGANVFGDADKGVYCLNETTGENIWTYITGDNMGCSSPAVVNGRVFIGSFDNHVYCLNETDGKQLWNYTASSHINSSPAVANGRVFIASMDGNIYCLNETTGTHIWTTTCEIGYFPLQCSPAVADGMVFINSGGPLGLIALNETTGALVWNCSVGPSAYYSSPAVANGKVFIGAMEGIFCVGSPPVLTVYSNGVSSHSPVTVTLNGASVGTVYDSHPLEIVLDSDRVPITATIGINNTRIWSINPHSRYSFTKWTGPATGTNTSNPITVALSTNSSCTANYKTQHLTNITFKDNSGTISIEPTQIIVLAPNSSLVILSSFLNQWLDEETWTIKQIQWQGSNVKPSIDPTYVPTPGGTWSINCRAYLISFSNCFKDSEGNDLYTLPSSFKLTFPNEQFLKAWALG